MLTEIAQATIALMMMLFVAGCASGGYELNSGRADNWGEANRQTMMAQVIDPAPDYGDTQAESSGTQAAAAIDRYRKDQVKKPERANLGKPDVDKAPGAGSPGGK